MARTENFESLRSVTPNCKDRKRSWSIALGSTYFKLFGKGMSRTADLHLGQACGHKKKNVSCQNMSLLWNSSVDIVTNNTQYTTTCTNLHPTGEIYFLTPLDVSFPKGTKVLFSVTIGILKSPNPRNRNSISVIKSKFLSVSSMNTLLAILKVTDARRDVILVGGLYHRFPWRHLPLRFYKQDRRFRILRFSSVAM